LLPNFTSRQINIGCDETYDVGQGRSHDAVERLGRGRVYLDFLKKIIVSAQRDGHAVQFWGDILQHHPDLVGEIPPGVIALEWGYGANHDFDGRCGLLAKAGVPFYVCPGTSAWNSLSGMLVNAKANLLNAAVNGRKHGAAGYLNTEWGDGGHWQQWPVALPSVAYGASVSWATEANRDLDLPGALSLHLFQDRTGQLGRIACELAELNQTARSYESNGLGFSIMLGNPDQSAADGRCVEGKPACFYKALETIARLRRDLAGVRLECADADLIRAEYEFTFALVTHACHMGLARAESLAPTTAAVPAERRQALAREIEPLAAEFRRLWLARSRPGGLNDSVRGFERLLTIYKT
jgi:hexosaminidase